MADTLSNGSTTHPKKAWVTLITKASYLPGLLVLHYSLRRARSAYPLVALYTDAFPSEGHAALDTRNITKRRITELLPSTDRSYGADPRFADTWSKLAAFGLTEFERVVLLDSDMLVRRNMDELMDLELDAPQLKGKGARVFAASHACVCNPLKKPHYPSDWVPANCAFTRQHADAQAAQMMGGGNDESFGMPNSGAVVLNPSVDALMAIREQLKSGDTARYSFPDQELLADVFRTKWVTLPYVYNALKPMRKQGIHDAIWRDHSVKNVHYILNPKPWEERSEQADEVNRWWHEANQERLDEEKRNGIYDGIGDTALLNVN